MAAETTAPATGWRVEVRCLGEWRPVHPGKAFRGYDQAARVAGALRSAADAAYLGHVRITRVPLRAGS